MIQQTFGFLMGCLWLLLPCHFDFSVSFIGLLCEWSLSNSKYSYDWIMSSFPCHFIEDEQNPSTLAQWRRTHQVYVSIFGMLVSIMEKDFHCSWPQPLWPPIWRPLIKTIIFVALVKSQCFQNYKFWWPPPRWRIAWDKKTSTSTPFALLFIAYRHISSFHGKIKLV